MISVLNQYFFGPLLPILLVLSGLFFAIKLRFFCVLHPLKTLKGLFGRKKSGESSSLRSMMTALAGTLGVGNITGVAGAITAGGPGAVFWMWVSAFAVMTVKYAEIVLACRFRVKGNDGKLHGGAPHYMLHGLKKPMLARVFALLLLLSSFSVGNMTQTSAAAETASAFLGVPRVLSGILLTVLLFAIVRGGAGRIVDFANRLIPPLSAIYALLSFTVIFRNTGMIPQICAEIVRDAFTPRAGIAGIAGYLMMPSLRLGTARGIFSNEAGCGTAPTAHAAAKAKPAEQGLFGIFEVFVDTVLLCTLTAFVVLISFDHMSAYDGTELAIRSFSAVLGNWVEWFLALSVVLYALASTVAWAYYGIEALHFLGKGKAAEKKYRLLYSAACFLGAICPMGLVWEWSDFTVCLMTAVNLICVLVLSGQVKEETLDYFER